MKSHMITLILCIGASLLLMGGCATWSYPEHGGEAIVGMPWGRHGEVPRIMVAQEESLPKGVRVDLAALNAAISELPYPLTELHVFTSPNGKSVVASKRTETQYTSDNSVPPSGVWIWPDWRDATRIIEIPDYSNARFVRPSTYWLELTNPQPDAEKLLINMRSPDKRFVWRWQETQLLLWELRMIDDGHWAAIDRKGRVSVGVAKGPVDDWLSRGTQIPTDKVARTVLLARDDPIVVVEFEDDSVETWSADCTRMLDQTPAYKSIRQIRLAQLNENEAFFGWSGRSGDSRMLVNVAEDGAMRFGDCPGWLHEISPMSYAPSGRYVICSKSVFPPGAVKSSVRRTISDSEARALPPYPKMNGPVVRVDAPAIGWLAWD